MEWRRRLAYEESLALRAGIGLPSPNDLEVCSLQDGPDSTSGRTGNQVGDRHLVGDDLILT